MNLEIPDFDNFAEKCVEDLKQLQDKFYKEYNIPFYENWFYNQAVGLLTFSTGDKEINFKYVEVGSFSEKSKTWKWSWNNKHTLDNVKEKAEPIREFGKNHNFPKLTNGFFTYHSKIEDILKNGRPLFEDNKYVIERTCSGEWGGTIRFRNKITGELRACSATCPIAVNKVNGKYIVTNTLRHLAGFSEVLEIANPDSLSPVVKPKPRVNENGKSFARAGDDESNSKKGTVLLLDSVGVLTLGCFPHNGELNYIVSDRKKTYVAQIKKKRFVVVNIIIENLDILTYDPGIVAIDDDHWAVKINGGYTDVSGNTITFLR